MFTNFKPSNLFFFALISFNRQVQLFIEMHWFTTTDCNRQFPIASIYWNNSFAFSLWGGFAIVVLSSFIVIIKYMIHKKTREGNRFYVQSPSNILPEHKKSEQKKIIKDANN